MNNSVRRRSPKPPRQPYVSHFKPLWDEPRGMGMNTPNLIGYYQEFTGQIVTPNGNPSLPAGGNQIDEVLIMLGKKRPSKAFSLRYARMIVQQREGDA